METLSWLCNLPAGASRLHHHASGAVSYDSGGAFSWNEGGRWFNCHVREMNPSDGFFLYVYVLGFRFHFHLGAPT